MTDSQTDPFFQGDADEDPFFGGVEFVENPEPRCPCVILLETGDAEIAGSMREIEEALRSFRKELQADELASKRVELAILTYGPTRVARDFQSMEGLQLPKLDAGEGAPLGEALEMAIEMIEERKAAYREHGVAHYRPWILSISSGRSTDSWENAADLLRSGEALGSFTFRAIALEGADTEVLTLLSDRPVRHLAGLRFQELFTWLGQSLSAVSRSRIGVEIDLPEPVGWAVV